MSAYLDASVIVPLFLADPHSERAVEAIAKSALPLVFSDWALLEVANVISKRVRMQAMTAEQAAAANADVDLWRARLTHEERTTAADVAIATAFVRRTGLILRGPDALHLAIAERLGATLVTFDVRMADAAVALGLPVAT